jgi:hypothetical protein
MNWNAYCLLQSQPCSAASAEFLQSNHLSSGLYTLYDWGGWLIWNYPDVKPSIDGRMHLWRDKKGYSFTADYDQYENGTKSLDNSPFNVVYRSTAPDPVNTEMGELVKDKKWQVAYVDDYAVIYERLKK